MLLSIGQASAELGISADTLRYYEKINLLPRVARAPSGLRRYDDKDLSRLRFIKRAQKMGFSLAEIAHLLAFREDPRQARPQVRQLAATKLNEVLHRIEDLSVLRDELTLLVNLCAASEDGCPILEGLDEPAANHGRT